MFNTAEDDLFKLISEIIHNKNQHFNLSRQLHNQSNGQDGKHHLNNHSHS